MARVLGGSLWCSAFTLIGLALSLWWALYSDGGVYPSTRAISLVGIALSAAFFQLFGANSRPIPLPMRVRQMFSILLCLVFFQAVPLPFALMRVLSPARADLMQAVFRITGQSGWAPIDVNSAMSFLELTTVLGCVLVFLVVRQLAYQLQSRKWWIIIPVLIAGLAEALLGLSQAAETSGPATAMGTFLNRNHLAGFLELLLPFTLIGGWATVRSRQLSAVTRFGGGMFLFACGLLFLNAIFYTYSRMGSFVVVYVCLFTTALTVWPYARVSRRRVFAGVAISVLLIAAAASLVPKRLVNRLENTSPLDRISTDLRLGFWTDSLPLLGSFWITGCGLGGFESVYPRYQHAGTIYRVEYAHNDYLQAAIELGIPAFLIGLYLLVSLVVYINRSIWSGASPQDRLIAIACLGSTGGMLIHSFVDFNLQIPANAISFAWVLGLGLSTKNDGKIGVQG